MYQIGPSPAAMIKVAADLLLSGHKKMGWGGGPPSQIYMTGELQTCSYDTRGCSDGTLVLLLKSLIYKIYIMWQSVRAFTLHI